MARVSGGDATDKYLAGLADKLGAGNVLKVGFLETAKYPDGTPVAFVAAIQNFGGGSTPPRPFFTQMVTQEGKTWGDILAGLLQSTDNDVEKALGMMGEYIKGQLQRYIIATNAPPLSKITLMLRKMKREDQNLTVTGSTVGEAARRVAAGEDVSSENQKPLIETSHMINSVDYAVEIGNDDGTANES